MNYTKLDDYAHFENDPATVESLFFNEQMTGLLVLIEGDEAKARVRQQIVTTIQNVLTELQKDEKNQPEGGLKIVVGSHHVQLREVLFKIVRSGIPLVAKAFLIGAGNLEIGLAVGAAAISTRELIQKLDASELDACEAVLRVISHKEPLVLTVHKASLKEIEAIFDHDPELTKPDDLKDTLNELVRRKVLERERVGDTTYYKITF